jgi:hypothetical protein
VCFSGAKVRLGVRYETKFPSVSLGSHLYCGPLRLQVLPGPLFRGALQELGLNSNACAAGLAIDES